MSSVPSLPIAMGSQTTVTSRPPPPPPSPAFGVQDPFGYHAARMVGEGRVPGVPNIRDYDNSLDPTYDFRYMARVVRDRLRDVRQLRGRGDGDTPLRMVATFEAELDMQDDVDTPKFRTPATIPREVKRLRIDMKW